VHAGVAFRLHRRSTVHFAVNKYCLPGIGLFVGCCCQLLSIVRHRSASVGVTARQMTLSKKAKNLSCGEVCFDYVSKSCSFFLPHPAPVGFGTRCLRTMTRGERIVPLRPRRCPIGKTRTSVCSSANHSSSRGCFGSWSLLWLLPFLLLLLLLFSLLLLLLCYELYRSCEFSV